MRYGATILGCGSSGGVPRIGIGWGSCDPMQPKNRRRRCSLLVRKNSEAGQTTLLVDTSPDLREQLLMTKVTHLDALFYTHEHADHTHGIDDIRPLVQFMRSKVAAYADADTLALLKTRFGYCFDSPPGSEYPPILDAHLLLPDHEQIISGAGGAVTVLPIPLIHGCIASFGFRFGAMAYAPDLNHVPDSSLSLFEGLEVLILDALRESPHPSHFSLQEALCLVDRVKPVHTILTNLHTDMDYDTLRAKLPPSVEPAFDGMEIGWE
jgi:phosphoribosyl 1,2-cyclic phosphate phosphodiesterase